MIKILFGKILLTCDHPSVYLRPQKTGDADRVIAENRWMALTVKKDGVLEKIIFLCGPLSR